MTTSRTVAVSGINLYTAGPLMIARDFLATLRQSPALARGDFRVIFFCHARSLYADLTHPSIEMIEKPLSRKSWLFRLWFEYVYFERWSRRRDIDTWVSLHDVTPNVHARHRFVYCHNPTPLYEGPRRWFSEPRFEIFRAVYRLFYGFNIHENERVIVQQQWIRDQFVRFFGCDPQKIIVAHPRFDVTNEVDTTVQAPHETTLIYPALPRFFKNHEVLLEAMSALRGQPVRLQVTISGRENRYARFLAKKFGDLPNVDFLGYLSRDRIAQLYHEADALVFPSTLETWGLPLSEFRHFNKPIFAAALPYAWEVLSGYDKVRFFDPRNPEALAADLLAFVKDRTFTPTPVKIEIAEPHAEGWPALLARLGLWSLSS